MSTEMEKPGEVASPSKADLKKWESEETIKKVADFLRGRRGMPIRHGIELGKRVEFFKGDRFCSFLVTATAKSRSIPTVETKEEALAIGKQLLINGYIHRSERDAKKKKLLTPSRSIVFENAGYYTWMYEGSKTMHHFLTAMLIVGFLGATCFPIWPMWMKVGLWYVSVTLLCVLVVFSVVRLVIFFLAWLCGVDLWILPNIFDDTLSVADSFKPLVSANRVADSERYYRVAGIIAMTAFMYWMAHQPTDFDEYVSITKQFTEDLYSGKLLAEFSQTGKDDEGLTRGPRVPDLDDLLKEEEGEEDEDEADYPVLEGEGSNEAEGGHGADDIMDRLLEEEEEDEDDEDEAEKKPRNNRTLEEVLWKMSLHHQTFQVRQTQRGNATDIVVSNS